MYIVYSVDVQTYPSYYARVFNTVLMERDIFLSQTSSFFHETSYSSSSDV
jgi:hypothetical protein